MSVERFSGCGYWSGYVYIIRASVSVFRTDAVFFCCVFRVHCSGDPSFDIFAYTEVLQPIPRYRRQCWIFPEERKILEIKTGDELEMLSCQFNKMAERIEEFIKRRIQDERINKKLKFDMLMSKIHPHFLYNTLNSVIYLARRDHNQDIEKMVQSLILILQDGMAAYSGKSCAMLKEELEVVSAYCVIQNYRYKDKVSVSIEVPDELTTAYVPKNILQPLVENSIYHGIAPMEENGSIEILAEQRGYAGSLGN